MEVGLSSSCSGLPFTPLLVATLRRYAATIQQALDGESVAQKALCEL